MAALRSCALTRVAAWSMNEMLVWYPNEGLGRRCSFVIPEAGRYDRWSSPCHSTNPSEFPVNCDGWVWMNSPCRSLTGVSVTNATPRSFWRAAYSHISGVVKTSVSSRVFGRVPATGAVLNRSNGLYPLFRERRISEADPAHESMKVDTAGSENASLHVCPVYRRSSLVAGSSRSCSTLMMTASSPPTSPSPPGQIQGVLSPGHGVRSSLHRLSLGFPTTPLEYSRGIVIILTDTAGEKGNNIYKPV